jgi:hypothetical protein
MQNPPYVRVMKTIAALLSLAFLGSCGKVRLKALSNSEAGYDCFKEDAGSKNGFSRIEEDLHKSGALETRTIKLGSEIGMIEKTAKLYILNKSDYILIFHFMHMVDLEIKNYAFSINGDSGAIAAGVLDIDSKYTVGQATDEYLYHHLLEKEAKDLANAKNVTVLVDDIPFEIPYACREAFRNALSTL